MYNLGKEFLELLLSRPNEARELLNNSMQKFIISTIKYSNNPKNEIYKLMQREKDIIDNLKIVIYTDFPQYKEYLDKLLLLK